GHDLVAPRRRGEGRVALQALRRDRPRGLRRVVDGRRGSRLAAEVGHGDEARRGEARRQEARRGEARRREARRREAEVAEPAYPASSVLMSIEKRYLTSDFRSRSYASLTFCTG